MKRKAFKTISSMATQPVRGLSTAVVCFAVVLCLAMTQCAFASSEGGSGLNPLESFQRDLAIWTAVVFIGLVLVLGKFAFRPIATALDQREQSLADRVASAEKANADARQLLDQYQQRLAGSEQEVEQMLKNAKEDAEKSADTIIQKAKQAAENEHKRALNEIEAATDLALQELASKSADLATNLAGKILKQEIDSKRHSELINGAMRQFSKK